MRHLCYACPGKARGAQLRTADKLQRGIKRSARGPSQDHQATSRPSGKAELDSTDACSLAQHLAHLARTGTHVVTAPVRAAVVCLQCATPMSLSVIVVL